MLGIPREGGGILRGGEEGVGHYSNITHSVVHGASNIGIA